MKKCEKCHIVKDMSDFCKATREYDGLQRTCKECNKKYRETNKQKNLDYRKEYYETNKIEIAEKGKIYRNQKKDYIRNRRQEYYKNNKEQIREERKKNRYKVNEYQKTRYLTNDKYRFLRCLRTRVQKGFKLYSKNGKTKSCEEYGIDFESIYNHVGPKPDGEYQLDHIIALSLFDHDNPIHVKLAHSKENLRWITSAENISKNDTIPYDLIYCSLKLTIIAKEIGII